MFEFGGDPFAFFRGKPARFARPVREIKNRDHAKHDRGNSFDDEKPAPSLQAEPVHSQQPPSERGADDVGDGDRNHEHGASFRAIFGAEPVREVDENAGKEAGFGRAQQYSNEVEMRGRSNESHQDGDESPCNHDAREPFAGAPTLDDDAAGNFEEQIANKKYSRAEAEDAVAEVEVVRHFEGGVADVYAVKKSDHEKCEEEWQEPARNVAACGLTDAAEGPHVNLVC